SCLGTKLLLSLAAADGSGSSRRTWHQRWRRQIAQWMRLQENFDEQHSDEYEDCTDSESDVEADIATGSAVAKAVFKMRGCFTFWIISATCLAPFAYWLILDAAPMTKEAPQGTESREAMNLFQQHFPDLSHMRREMVVISC
ncbi:unnamed protein product, partial [Prorocentrum cordatum]